MATLNIFLEEHHKVIIAALSLAILAMVVSCTFNGAIPICHYLFGCDHQLHGAGSLGS